ncbi:hypothetical protein EMPS_09158 [Entomortierella parvispora]|uniref:Transmembrane protein n=1 Tax=Entomortierella parvispora TaxID=205924 RepID=A0A9P3HHF9_9FUNG|nr:hypothetical protein EMPS_09158 [Entomortierella parvispora]
MFTNSTTLARRTRTRTRTPWIGPITPLTIVDQFPTIVTSFVPKIADPVITSIVHPTSTLPPTTKTEPLPTTTTERLTTTTAEPPTTTTKPPTTIITTATTTTTTTKTTTLSTSTSTRTLTITGTSTGSSTSSSTNSSSPPPTTTTRPTIPPTETPTPSDDNSNRLSTGAIVGIAVAALAAIIALTALAMFASRRRRRQKNRNTDLMFNPVAIDLQENRAGRQGGDSGGDGILTGAHGQQWPATGNGGRIPPQAPSMGTASLLGENQISQISSGGMGYESDILAGGGEAAAMGGAYGYEANRRRQMQQQQMHQEAGGRQGDYYGNQQRIVYASPTEPGMTDEERYNPEYAAQREQEAARYNQYQQYLADQEWRQAAAVAPGGVAGGAIGGVAGQATSPYYGGVAQQPQAEYGIQGDGYYSDQQRYSGDQFQHLQQQGQGFERPAGVFSPSRVSPGVAATYPSTQSNNNGQFNYDYRGQTLPDQGYVAPYPPTAGVSSLGDYATTESDARFTKSEPWPEVSTPATSRLGAAPAVPAVIVAPAPTSASATKESTRVDNTKRNSQLSVESASSSNSGVPRRVHSPQLIPPSPKRAPQVLYPETEPSFSSS